MDVRDHARVESLFGELDAFLLLQFEVLAGGAAPDVVATAHAALVEHVGRLAAEDPPRAMHWDRWHDMLRGADVLLSGFPALHRDRLPTDDAERYLRHQQARLRLDPNAARVRERLDLDYEALWSSPLFGSIRDCDADWLERHDVPLRAPPDPHALAVSLFHLDGKPDLTSRLAVDFREIRAAEPRFFMVRLHGEPRCLIGHAPVTTLFRLSSLAHEIGHASSYELGRTLEASFTAIDADGLSAHERSEIDSYRYERLIADHLAELAGPLLDDVANGQALLRRRKALQAARHILACELASLFFAGHEPRDLAVRFETLVQQHLPSHATEQGWLAATDLARPLARLPFVHAFREVFA